MISLKLKMDDPKVLSISDYNSILQSDAHFARKFDMAQDRIILDILDEKITALPHLLSSIK